MHNLGTLYKMEVHKILCKKSVWIAMVLGIFFVLAVSLTSYLSSGYRDYYAYQKEVLLGISGKKMDQAFFERFHQAVEEELERNADTYNQIRSNDPGAVYMNAARTIGMDNLYYFIYNVTRDREVIPTVTADEFYDCMRNNIVHDGRRELGCSEAEIESWLTQYDSIETPLTFLYAQAYVDIIDSLFLAGWVLFLTIAVALAGVFADEKTHRTDAMILSARKGRGPDCVAKMLAGITVALLQMVLLLGTYFGALLLAYGTSGWNAAIQLIIPSSPWNITVWGMILIYLGLAVVTSILFAFTNMTISYFTSSAVATISIHAALLFVGLFNFPKSLGLFAKLWQLRPTMALYYGSFCNTFRYFGMDNISFSLVIYMSVTAILAAILTLSYRNCQISSR